MKKHLVISLNKTLTKIWKNKKITLLHQKVKQGRNRTCKPGSVENSDLSWLYVAIQLAPPFGTRRAAALFLLVLLRIGFTWQYSRLYSGELLPRLSILAKKIFGGFFLLHFPSSRLGLPLAGILPYEARTFLTACAVPLSSPLPEYFYYTG